MNMDYFIKVMSLQPILENNKPNVLFAIVVTIFILIFLKLFSVICIFFMTEYEKYNHKMYLKRYSNMFTKEKIQTMYYKIREEFNGNQLEFSFVKDIDNEYIVKKYNLNTSGQ